MSNKQSSTIYFVDSENVNDVWIQLALVADASDELLVFYTDKSPHMSYERVIELTRMTDRSIEWIKCVEGSNALDFQLVTELGARVALCGAQSFVIVSNDTGFDAAVRYWTSRGKSVRRMKSTECKKLAQQLRAGAEAKTAQTGQTKQKPSKEACETVAEPAGEDTLEPRYMEDIEKLCASIPLTKLTMFHDAFVCMYDQSIGDEIYYYMKEHKEQFSGLEKYYLPKKKARVRNYFLTVLAHSDCDACGADALMEIYHRIDDPKKNLQKLNVEAVKRFGQEQGRDYYKLLKKHIKIMSKL